MQGGARRCSMHFLISSYTGGKQEMERELAIIKYDINMFSEP